MSYVMSALREFYQKAPRCPDVQGKNERSGGWQCRLTGKLCGPKSCPKEPELVASLEERAEIQIEEPNRLQVEHTVQEPSILQTAVSGSSIPHLNSTSLSKEEMSPKIMTRDAAKSKSKPHVKRGHVKRATVTFIEKKTKQLQRWGVDLCFSQTTRRTSILKFRKGRKGDDVRFYFGKGVSDGDAERCVGSWFGSLHVHDPESFVNSSGSPENFSIDIFDEA